jgi:hypothetical protein
MLPIRLPESAHLYSIRPDEKVGPITDTAVGEGELWNPAPVLSFVNTKAVIFTTPCTCHTRTPRFRARATIIKDVRDGGQTGTYVYLESRACYSNKAKARVDIALQIARELGLQIKDCWKKPDLRQQMVSELRAIKAAVARLEVALQNH